MYQTGFCLPFCIVQQLWKFDVKVKSRNTKRVALTFLDGRRESIRCLSPSRPRPFQMPFRLLQMRPLRPTILVVEGRKEVVKVQRKARRAVEV